MFVETALKWPRLKTLLEVDESVETDPVEATHVLKTPLLVVEKPLP